MTNEQESENVRHFKETKIKAEQGDAKAQYILGLEYSHGVGVPMDSENGWKWIRKAAEQGHAEAQFELGGMYLVEPQDYKEAAKWIRKAADQGDAMAQYQLGQMYSLGKGVSENDAEAVKWFRKAAEQGHAMAQYSLGWMYWHGQGVPRDDLEALQWTQNAAEQGDAEARTFLKRMHEFVVTEIKAEKGDAEAQYNLGQMYYDDEIAPQDGERRANGWKWILEAAKQGHARAHLWFAEMYWNSQEYMRAFEWTRQAAYRRHADAQFWLAHKYYDGEVVPKNFIEAYAWFLVAKANGNEHAEEKISDLEERLTAEGIEKGQARAAELQRLFGTE